MLGVHEESTVQQVRIALPTPREFFVDIPPATATELLVQAQSLTLSGNDTIREDMEGSPVPSPASVGALVRATLAGDRRAYGRLYDYYARTIRAVCHDTTRDLNDAQDLCQEAFLRAYRELSLLRDPERFGGWLYGITRMVCREWRRKAVRERSRRSELSVDPAAPSETDSAEEGRSVLLELALLPERERTALHLYYIQERPVEDAQAILGLSRSGFYRVLERGRGRLRRALSRRKGATR